MTGRRWGWVRIGCGCAAVLLLGAGCGGGDPEPVETRSSEPTPAALQAPDVRGMLDYDAEDALVDAGYDRDNIEFVDSPSGGSREWVCSQRETGSDSITLVLAELCRNGLAVDPWHYGETRFVGEVTAHDEYGSGELTVDAADVDLGMIEPIGAQCSDVEREARDPDELMEKMLPIGTPVLVIGGSDDPQFVHVLTDLDAFPDPIPPDGAVNTALVATGYWLPEMPPFEVPELGDRKAKYVLAEELESGLLAGYAERIADAGNKARKAQTGPVKECLVIEKQDADNMARWEAELDSPDVDSPDSGDDDSDWWFDDGSGHPCLPGERDGDGDGMCGES